mgnify:CR=1 FL=1
MLCLRCRSMRKRVKSIRTPYPHWKSCRKTIWLIRRSLRPWLICQVIQQLIQCRLRDRILPTEGRDLIDTAQAVFLHKGITFRVQDIIELAYMSGIVDKYDSALSSAGGRVVTLSFFDQQGYQYTAKLFVRCCDYVRDVITDNIHSCLVYF